jgi:hypothetical protein
MGKYAALETFLLTQKKTVIPTTFAQIESVVGHPLPASAKYPAWWSNNPSNNSMTKVWRRAGFRTEQVDVVQKTLVFRRRPPTAPEPPMSKEQWARTQENVRTLIDNNKARAAEPASIKSGFTEGGRPCSASHHPLRGALKGVLRLVGGTDLTKPADPEWGKK